MASGGQISLSVTPSATECQSSFNIATSREVFEGTVAFVYIFTMIYAARFKYRATLLTKGPLTRSVRTPLAEAKFGELPPEPNP